MRLFFLIVVALAIVMLARAYFNMSVEVTKQDMTIFNNRLFFDTSLVYQDKITDRIYPGIFVKEKINDSNFVQSVSETIFYGEENHHIAAKIQLKSSEEELVSFFNPGTQKGYDEWILLAKSNILGLGGAIKEEYVLPNIIIIDQDVKNTKTALLNLTTVMRRS
jgi:hypothetical protein